jgi:hypothetical protein
VLQSVALIIAIATVLFVALIPLVRMMRAIGKPHDDDDSDDDQQP